jgi:O-antigen/teichoic acid export membrane protein
MLLRNSIWNLTGLALPTLVALATVPILIHYLGMEGFGVITLIGSVVGYFGVLDLNLSAGSIKYLAQFHAQQEEVKFSETFWFGFIFYSVLGLCGCVILFASAELIIRHLFYLSTENQQDLLLALRLAAVGFFLTQLQSYLLVIPQALQRYDYSAKSECLFGILFNISSALVAWLHGGIVGVIAVRVVIAALNLIYLFGLLHHLGISLRPRLPSRAILRLLTRFSAYAYLSRMGSLLHQYGDKLIIGILAGPVAVTLYTVPSQLASRLLGLTYRLSSVIYPRVSAFSATGELSRLKLLYLDSSRLVTYLNTAVLGIIILCGEQFLSLWVGEQFVSAGYPILILIALAMFLDSLTNLPTLVNDGVGHPQITGQFALARGIVGIALVFIGTSLFTIQGAAAAHVIASLIMSFLFLYIVHGRTVPASLRETTQLALLPSSAIGIAVLLTILPTKYFFQQDISGLILLAVLSTIAYSAIGLLFIVNASERSAVLTLAKKIILPA